MWFDVGDKESSSVGIWWLYGNEVVPDVQEKM